MQPPHGMNPFEFVVVASLRAAQLIRGCTPRVDGVHKVVTIAQLEVAGRKVARAAQILRGPAVVLAGLADDVQRAGPAHGILEQLERHAVANTQIVEGGAIARVAAVEEYVAMVRQPDEAVTLANGNPDDAPRRAHAAKTMGNG